MSNKHSHLRLTPDWLKTDDYRSGPCYVLDPEAWMRGQRVVVRVIEPEPPKAPPERPELLPAPTTGETRRMVQWAPGDPLSWTLVDVPVQRREPAWAARARKLRALGWSERRIMKELDLKNKQALGKVLGRTG